MQVPIRREDPDDVELDLAAPEIGELPSQQGDVRLVLRRVEEALPENPHARLRSS